MVYVLLKHYLIDFKCTTGGTSVPEITADRYPEMLDTRYFGQHEIDATNQFILLR